VAGAGGLCGCAGCAAIVGATLSPPPVGNACPPPILLLPLALLSRVAPKPFGGTLVYRGVDAQAIAGGLEHFGWYRQLGAASMEVGMADYEAEVERRKRDLFSQLPSTVNDVLEIGLGYVRRVSLGKKIPLQR
jgi:hypothetical protein